MELDPASLTLEEMMQLDSLALHQMAKKSTGSLTRYRALLGRLLLAIHRTDAYLEHGCSSGVHYAILQLGLSRKEARLLILVARDLESLPHLRYLANNGNIEWSKLREIVRVATPETEQQWAELCSNHTYAQIEARVAQSQRGEIPPERATSSAPRSEFRCQFEPDQMAVMERGLQVVCQLAGRALSMAEAIELLFAEKLAEHDLDEENLENVRQESLKDLQWTDLIQAETEDCPGNPEITIINPKSRVPTKAQRRKILRRDGYRCCVPGCLEVSAPLEHTPPTASGSTSTTSSTTPSAASPSAKTSQPSVPNATKTSTTATSKSPAPPRTENLSQQILRESYQRRRMARAAGQRTG